MSSGDFEEVLEELVQDILSWDGFYITADKPSSNVLYKVSLLLDYFNLSYFIVDEKDTDFNFTKGDCLLAISFSDECSSIVNIVSKALYLGVKVYSISPFKNELSFLADENILIEEEHFDDFLLELNEKLKMAIDEEDELKMVHRKGNTGGPASKIIPKLLLLIVLMALIVIFIFFRPF